MRGPTDEFALRELSRRKQALALLLQEISASLRRTGGESLAARSDELLVKLAENRFTLAVVGQLKRGKSTLINALVRRMLLPTGIVPLTSTITALRYGTSDRLLIKHTDSHLMEQAPVTALSDYVTERGNSGNRRQVETVWVEAPSTFLRRGLEFVDTPGIGSTIEANTRRTLDFIPRCDAVLLVTSAEAPLSALEIDFLRLIRQHVRKCFFVLNKMDLAEEAEVDEVIKHTEATLTDVLGTDAFQLFPVSCRTVVEPNVCGNSDEYGGLGVVRRALSHFLVEECTATLLASVARKARQICSTAGGPAQAEEAESLARFSAQLARMDLNDSTFADSILQPPVGGTAEQLSLNFRPPAGKSKDTDDLRAALRTRGCVVCDHLVKVAFDFFCRFQFELSIDAGVQRDFAARGGFCPLHAWQLASGASPRGLSSGLPLFAQRIAVELVKRAASGEPSLTELVADSTRCAVCSLLRDAESFFLQKLAEYSATDSGAAAVGESQGPCLIHLERLLNLVPEAVGQQLLRDSARRFDELAEDMRAYVLKRDTLRRPLINGDEEDACQRVLTHLFGDRRARVSVSDT